MGDPFVNRNNRDSPMGRFCWAFTELAHMTQSFSVPIVDGKPLYTNEYVDADRRRSATESKLAALVGQERAVSDELPPTVRPLADFLVTKQTALAESVRTDASLDGIRDYHTLFSSTLGDSDTWPAVEAFAESAAANPDCNLETR